MQSLAMRLMLSWRSKNIYSTRKIRRQHLVTPCLALGQIGKEQSKRRLPNGEQGVVIHRLDRDNSGHGSQVCKSLLKPVLAGENIALFAEERATERRPRNHSRGQGFQR